MFNINPCFYDIDAYQRLRDAVNNTAVSDDTQSASGESSNAYHNADSSRYVHTHAVNHGYDNADAYHNANSYQYAPPEAPYFPAGFAAMPGYGNLSHLAQGYSALMPSHEVSYPTSSASSHGPTLRFDRAEGWSEPGCVVACIAMVAGVPYKEARDQAASVADFDGERGLTFIEAKDILESMGVEATRHDQDVDWSDLPDLAIVSVQGEVSEAHSVVFERNGDNEYIYDWKNYAPVPRSSSYELLSDDYYLEIHR
ncbi:hypothetical protein JMY81_06360 [Brenneria goodwinii]|uniref:Peptidase C39 domain-containing protein n=1 Tax=Brenneria goodwinii TaxID=1109412 RepID=A0A0G4JPY1_9GAMM|nr:hypothetical protein [Brenneria goodwinii]MCG8155514.1 hypothetical protein [Brenneria goodwinii]MCG8160459.1 hypothetical protein [Brenneria goodwinii]MCG8164982.1 hypothetical protein [Brenneria goodwinii]MCG8169361.1 hypothetical protein [Brenneria goodwinii]MCG8174535.1 hypothetical protein [Brenneria goodwinii]